MQSYIPAVRRWGRSDTLVISFRGLEDAVSGHTVSFPSNTVSVPYGFVKGAGWAEAALLEDLAQQCVNEEGRLLRSTGEAVTRIGAVCLRLSTAPGREVQKARVQPYSQVQTTLGTRLRPGEHASTR